MNQCKISIIVPIYNVEKYLAKCLDSLVNQTMKEIEILLVNDVSPDDSKKIMEEYRAQYPHLIKCLYQEENSGQGMARNRGMDEARGEYLLFVDGDDYIDVTMCEKLYDVAFKHHSDVVCCEYYEVKQNGKCNEISGYATQVMGELNDEKRRLLVSSLSVQPVCKLIRKSILVDNQIYFQKDYKCGEDYLVVALLWIYAERIDEVKEALYYYIRHDNSATTAKNNPHFYDVYKVAICVCEELKRRGFDKEYEFFKEDILVRGLIEETKFFVNCVDKPNIEEMKFLRDSVQKHIPNYSKCLTAYMRNEPKAIAIADMLMESLEEFCDVLEHQRNEKVQATYRPFYEMCEDRINKLFTYCKKNAYNIAVWGAGLKGKDFLKTSDPEGIHIRYVVDKNEKNWNTQLETGHVINGFQEVSEDIDVVLVMNKVYFGGIYREVKAVNPHIKIVNFDILLISSMTDDFKEFME